MDIATTQHSAPPPVILREDYRPPEWLVNTVTLRFALGVDETRVTATLAVRRNPEASGSQTIRLMSWLFAESVQPLNSGRFRTCCRFQKRTAQ